MQKKTKITKEQIKKQKEIMQEFNDKLEAEEAQEAVDFKKADEMPDKMWACTPEIKLKASQPAFDLQLTEEQTRGGVIRIIRTGSNKIKICSVVEKSYLNDGLAEAEKEFKNKKDK